MATSSYLLNRYQRTLGNKARLLQQRIAIEADISSKKHTADVRRMKNQIRTAEHVGKFGIDLYDAKKGGYFEDKDFGDFLEESYGLPSSRPKSTPGKAGEAGGSLEDILAERRGNRRVTWGDVGGKLKDVGGKLKDRGGEFLDNARGLFPESREKLSKWATGGYISPQDNTTLGDRFTAASERKKENKLWEDRRQNLEKGYASRRMGGDLRTEEDIIEQFNRSQQRNINRSQQRNSNMFSNNDIEQFRRMNMYLGGR